MIEVRGNYLGGDTSTSVAARLVLEGEQRLSVVAHDGETQLVGDVSDLEIEARLGSTPRRVRLGAAGVFVTEDHRGIDALSSRLGSSQRLGWVAWLEARWPVAIFAVIVAFGGLGVFAFWGVPAIAEASAHAVPQWASEKLGLATLESIDQILDPSEIDVAERERLSDYFRSFGDVTHIEFRKAGGLGANALCLSADVVVFTDELVALAERDEELLAVYLHELGHARLRHVETSILQNSAWVVLFSLLVGDFSGMGEILISLPIAIGQAAFSKDLEREADQFAVESLIANGIDPTPLADILTKLEASHFDVEDDETSDEGEVDSPSVQDLEERLPAEREASVDSENEVVEETADDERWSRILFDYFSTHPATSERVAYIRSAATAANLAD